LSEKWLGDLAVKLDQWEIEWVAARRELRNKFNDHFSGCDMKFRLNLKNGI
jgi:hypothetical protein